MNIIIFRGHREYLRAKLKALLPNPADGMCLLHKGEHKKRDVDILVADRSRWDRASQRWDRGWDILYGSVETDTLPLPEEALFREKIGGSAFHQARCDYLASYFAWAICEWPGIWPEELFAFVTADRTLAERFLTSTPNKVRADRKLSPNGKYPMLVSSYMGIERLDDSLNGAVFYDHEHEGSFVWRLAEEEGIPAYVVAYPHSEEIWREQYAARLEAVTSGFLRQKYYPEFGSPYAISYVIYRATDAEAYHALWQSHWTRNQDIFPIVCVSGRANLRTLQAIIEKYHRSQESKLETLKRLSAVAGWAYTHHYTDENVDFHGLFWSEDPRQTQRLFRWITEAEPLYRRLLQYENTVLGGGIRTVPYRPVYPYGRL